MIVWLGVWNRTPPTPGPAIAVLAFEQWLPTAGESSLAAHMTESVTTELARLGTVGVASHTSAMQFAGARKPLREIALALNANYILEASLEREPNGVLVTARIVSAETNRKIWVADYRGAADDVRGISQRIAFDVSAELLRLAR
jgi:TolB-like protein